MSPSCPPQSQPAPLTPDAFWQRWQLHRPALLRQCTRLLGSQSSDAEDAVSITLLSALQQLSRAAPPIVNETAWLSRILYNVCMDMHRYHKRFIEPVAADGQGEAEEWSAGAIQEVEQSAEEVLLAREQSRELHQHIQALPPRLRIPFVMRFQQDMSYPEIAAELNLTNCNVRKRIQLAYSQLRSASSGTARSQIRLQPPPTTSPTAGE